MIKRAITLTSLLCAIMIALLVFQYVSILQQRIPLGATNQFDLNLAESTVSKEQIITELNKITDDNNGVLVKTAVDSENYTEKKDIIWFGSVKPDSEGILIKDQTIHWFDSSIKGEMVSSTKIGSRPLSGTYVMDDNKAFQEDLSRWAWNNNIQISWIETPSLFKVIYSYLFLNGVGNAVLASFLLLLTTIITWFVSHAKSRAIRLLGGINTRKIHVEDTTQVSSFILKGFLLGLIVTLGYVGVTKGIQQIKLVINYFAGSLLFALVISCFLVAILSIIASPKPNHIAQRQIPLKQFNLLGKINRVAIIVLALIVIPTTIIAAIITNKLSNEHALWENMQTNVSLSFSELDTLETEKMLPEVESFFIDMYDNDNLQLSFVVDKGILLTESKKGGYDHIIITDRAWINSFGIGVDTQGESGKLVSKKFDSLPTELSDFLKGQLPIWTKSKEIQPEGLGFYEYVGENFLALPPNVSTGSETIQSQNPLVILVDHPIEVFKIKGFLLSLLSSGNIVFPNEEKLKEALSTALITPYISSIDGIADKALEMANKFKQEFVYYVMACILLLVSMFFAGILSGKLWAETNRKRIFTLHTYGVSYISIIKGELIKELATVLVTTIVGSVLVYLMYHTQLNVLVPVALSIVLAYSVGSLFAYRIYTKEAFHQMTHRYY